MSAYRPWDVDQPMLLPPSVTEFVPPTHLVHFVRDLVQRELDLDAIHARYSKDPRGAAPYHPGMMTALLVYSYCKGITSSRTIAQACEERVDFMALTGMQQPDFRTVADFRKLHLEALAGLFLQVLVLCRQAGLAKLGHVALDGTKVKANASKRKAMSYARMKEEEPKLAAAIEEMMKDAQTKDDAEDAEHGAELRGDEMPAWAATKKERLAKIREAKAQLEAAAKAEAAHRRNGPLTRAMRARLRRGGHASRYRLRKQTVEPVFGQIKEARGFRRFRLRGHRKVRGEWTGRFREDCSARPAAAPVKRRLLTPPRRSRRALRAQSRTPPPVARTGGSRPRRRRT